MALQFIYILLRKPNQLDDVVVEWVGTKKWMATEFLKERVVNGYTLAEFKVVKMRESQPLTMEYIDVYDFVSTDQGEML